MNTPLMCHVNLVDGEAFKANLKLMEVYQVANYKQAFSDYKKMGNNVYRFTDDYYDNARFIIYSELPFSSKYSRCGVKIGGLPGNCKKKSFCTCCAYKAGTDLWQRFKDCFYGRQAYFVTFGYEGGLDWQYRDDSNAYWEAAEYAVEKVINKKADGAMIVREMHVKAMQPLALNPHSHAILSFEGFAEVYDLQQRLQDGMEEYWQNHSGMEQRRLPNVDVKFIEDVDGYERCIRYMFKPIVLKKPYQTATMLHGTGPEVLMALNSEMKDFLKWITVYFRMKKTVRYKGVFASGKRSVVLSSKDLKRKRSEARHAGAIRKLQSNARIQTALARASRRATAGKANVV